MSALGQMRTLVHVCMMSALPPKADIVGHDGDVCFVAKADIEHERLGHEFRAPRFYVIPPKHYVGMFSTISLR
jgi:hypothetical protein